MSDAYEGLGEYLGVFSGVGAVPSSLSGYGFGGALSATTQPQSDAPAGPKPSANTLKIGTQRWQELRAMLIKDVQWGLNQIGYKAGTSGILDTATKNAWSQYVKLFTNSKGQPYAPDFVPASGGFDSSHWVWANTYALADLGARAKTASTKPAATPAANAKTAPAPAPAPAPAGNAFVTSVASVQDILVRLGWKDKNKTTGPLSKDMTDGLFGGTVVFNWQASANKRKLDPKIARDSGTTVSVNENTFLQLKAVADQMVPPQQNQPVVPAPSGTTAITEARLNEVLGRLANAPAGATQPFERLVSDYQTRAKAGGLDTSISKDQKGDIVVSTKTWDAFTAAFNSLPAPTPAKPTTGGFDSETEKAMDTITKGSTGTLPTKTLMKFFNIAITTGKLKREPFKASTWVSDYSPLIVTMLQVQGPVKTAWEQLLIPGRLVAKDLKSLKLPPSQVTSIQKVVSDYEAQKKADTQARAGYTKADSVLLINTVNNLSVSSKKFEPSGGATVLADALRTFLENTKQTAAGDIVWVSANKEIYVQDDVLKKLKTSTDAAATRAKATESYRAKMVDEALKASTASITVDDLQLAIIETVEAKKAGPNEKLFSLVKNTGTFDAATSNAYTELARTLTIGPAVQQLQKLLQEQMGPKFQAALVTEAQNKVWSDFLAKAVSGKTIKTLPTIAKNVMDAAATRRSRLGSQALDQQKKEAAIKDLAAALSKSTAVISVFDAQMGLLYAAEKKTLPYGAAGVKVTGVADDALAAAMKNFSSAAFTINPIPNDIWVQYLSKTGIKVSSSGSVFTWKGANWLAVPSSTATKLTGGATDYMKKKGVPEGYEGVVSKTPTGGEITVRFTKPTVVRATAPVKKTDKVIDFTKPSDEAKKLEAEKKKLQDQIKSDQVRTRKAKAEAARKRKEAEAAKAKAAQDASNAAAQAAAAAAEEVARAAEEFARNAAAQQASTQQALNTAAQGGAGGSVGPITINVPAPAPMPDVAPPAPAPAPEPAPAPTEPSPAPMQAGVFSPGALLLMSAVGLGFVFFGNKDKQQTNRYSKRGGRK